MTSILAASTENDKHALQSVPRSLGLLIPNCVSSSHDFFFGGAYQMNHALDASVDFFNNAYAESYRFLSIDLNDLFNPIHGFYILSAATGDPVGYQTSSTAIFKQYAESSPNDGAYIPQGTNDYRKRYKYYKIDKAEWHITIRNLAALDSEKCIAPVTIHTYNQNNFNVVPSLTNIGPTAANKQNVAALMVNPKVGTICGGEILGHTGIAGYSGIATATTPFPYAPELSTSFTYNNSSSVASDPNVDTNIKYWTATTTGSPNPPANINRLHFFAVPATYGGFTDNKIHFRPQVTLRARFHVTWRDHDATDPIFTKLSRTTNAATNP